MKFDIDYFTYEYGVLQGLLNIFPKASFTTTSTEYKALKKEVVQSTWEEERYVTINLPKDFKVGISTKFIVELYEKETPIEKSTAIVADLVKASWMSLILK